MSRAITVLIVDDHEVVRKGVRTFLETHPELEVVGEAESGTVALQLVEEHIPDVVLMDLIMPEMDGIEATRGIKRLSPRTQVVILTSYHEDEHIFPALQAGAISYILKDLKMDDLVDVVQSASRGEAILDARVAARIIQELHGAKSETANPLTDLTGRELDVLKLIANGLNNNEIAQELVISKYTVKGHVSNILGKLHLADRTQAAVYAWRQGIMGSE